MKNPLASFILLSFVCCFFAGCMNFGSDIELSESEITNQHLQQVSSLTGIQFPDGTQGLAYLYIGSGIDDYLTLKISIPADQKDTFLQNEIFKIGDEHIPVIQAGESKDWLKIDALTERIDRVLELPDTRYVECTLGIEDNRWIAYISWSSW